MKSSTISILADDGRHLCVSEAGLPGGIPVVVHHGTPGSRLLHPLWIENAKNCGIRLISYDRPGYGGSTRQCGRSVASAVEDVAAIAKHLGLSRLSVWGISGGGPHALACAALLPKVVAAAASIASSAPYPSAGLEWFLGMDKDNIDEFSAALGGKDKVEQYIEPLVPDMLSTTDPSEIVHQMRSLLCPADAAVMTEEYADFLTKSVGEGIRDRRDGWIDDDIALVTPWGFDLRQIRVPVLLLHGEQDQLVPVSHGKWLSKRIKNVDDRFLADEGHLSLKLRVPDVHAWLVSVAR